MPYVKHEWPTVTNKTIIEKVAQGFAQEGWKIVGPPGSTTRAFHPLIEYLLKKGVRVRTSAGLDYPKYREVGLGDGS